MIQKKNHSKNSSDLAVELVTMDTAELAGTDDAEFVESSTVVSDFTDVED